VADLFFKLRKPDMNTRLFVQLCFVPLFVFTLAFLALPLVRLAMSAGSSPAGWGIFWQILTTPRYISALMQTVVVSLATTVVALAISTTVGLFLARNDFRGRGLILSVLTLPLAFPGVVIGFLIILLGGRQGLFAQITSGEVIFAYTMFGLFLGYLYFSIPRVLLTVMAATEKLDRSLEEAARSLGAGSFQVIRDVILPGLMPSLIAAGAIAFATAMGAFGTAFTLATDIDVLPMVIYTEFTLSANIAMASALSILLGLVTWVMLLVARSISGADVAGGG
jgi:putative spermidine/putrescine transport system permease protein